MKIIKSFWLLLAHTYFKVFVRLEWILFQLLGFIDWCLNRFLLIYFLFLLWSSSLRQQVDSCLFASVPTLVGERHLAPGFKHWNWFYSLSFIPSIWVPLLWRSQFLATTPAPRHTEKWIRTHHAVAFKQCISVPVHIYSIYESACVISVFSCYILPLILCVYTSSWRVIHLGLTWFPFSLSVKRNWVTWSFTCSKILNSYLTASICHAVSSWNFFLVVEETEVKQDGWVFLLSLCCLLIAHYLPEAVFSSFLVHLFLNITSQNRILWGGFNMIMN